MTYTSIPSGWREVGQAVKKDLVDRIHDNLEDLNNRVTNVEGSVSTAVIANQLITKQRDHVPLGTIVWSPLSSAQFNAEIQDGGWQICSGGSVAGSDYATLMSRSNAPDIRGRFLRMKDNGAGRDSERDTDNAQADDNKAHTHNMDHGHAHTIAASGTFASSTHKHNISHFHIWATSSSGGETYYTRNTGSTSETAPGSGNYTVGAVSLLTQGATTGINTTWVQSGSQTLYTTGALGADSGSTDGSSARSGEPSATASVGNSGSVTNHTGSTGSTGTESRPINVCENAFIKINRNYIVARDGVLLWRAPQALTINQVVVSPVTQGTSGTLTVDIKHGPLASITTSIFTAQPELDYNDTDPVTGTLSGVNNQVAAGDYIRVDLTTAQAKLQEFHLLIAATPS